MRSWPDKLYVFFLVLVATLFFCLRPLNVPWQRVIFGDGLGYYSYLPAKFIYHDKNLDFRWFNRVYPRYYINNPFPVPDENILTGYKGKRINKYYPGESFLCFPFFYAAHLLSKLCGMPADGFSLFYQVAIGLAAVFYGCLGLWFLRKLLLNLFGEPWLATLVPMIVFFGTNLFSFTIFYGCFSHVYSFAFITMSLYFAHWLSSDGCPRWLLLFGFCFLVSVFIRPFNVVFVLALPAVCDKLRIKFRDTRPADLLIFALTGLLLWWQLGILHRQTGSFFPGTYTNEKFFFDKPHVFENLFSYRYGWFLYVPLSLVALASLFSIGARKKFLFIFLLLGAVLFLYSCWWYWPVFARGIVDFSACLAILICFLLARLRQKKTMMRVVMTLCIIFVSYFQLKAYQFRGGILDSNYNYGYYYWENFFAVHKPYYFLIHPKSIIKQELKKESFENNDGQFSAAEKYEGLKSLTLNAQKDFSPVFSYQLPPFMKENGIRKVRSVFYVKTDSPLSFELLYRFTDASGREVARQPLRVDTKDLSIGKWHRIELGCELPEGRPTACSVTFLFLGNKGEAHIGNMETGFFLLNDSLVVKL